VKKVIGRCPICSGELAINRLVCQGCNTQIESLLGIPPLLLLPEDLQNFVLIFLRCRGNIREVEKELGISYPTVCKRLDLVNQLLGNQEGPPPRTEILEQLERGEITVAEATQLLKGR
jgi:hypothetical protein